MNCNHCNLLYYGPDFLGYSKPVVSILDHVYRNLNQTNFDLKICRGCRREAQNRRAGWPRDDIRRGDRFKCRRGEEVPSGRVWARGGRSGPQRKPDGPGAITQERVRGAPGPFLAHCRGGDAGTVCHQGNHQVSSSVKTSKTSFTNYQPQLNYFRALRKIEEKAIKPIISINSLNQP